MYGRGERLGRGLGHASRRQGGGDVMNELNVPLCSTCRRMAHLDPCGNLGWLCPRCDRVNAPTVTQCGCVASVGDGIKAASAPRYGLCGAPDPRGSGGFCTSPAGHEGVHCGPRVVGACEGLVPAPGPDGRLTTYRCANLAGHAGAHSR